MLRLLQSDQHMKLRRLGFDINAVSDPTDAWSSPIQDRQYDFG